MRCHYEVLELDRASCNQDDIKRQYKRMALKWHPDRNHGQEELATANFKEVSAAYTVLSDVREKQWYDDHRDSILRGSSGTRGNKDDDHDDCMDLWGFFTEACYGGMDDSNTGFYRVYRDLFEALVTQENNSSNCSKLVDYPSYGDSTSTNAQVINFYNQWSNFTTVLSFSWEDEYNTTEAPDRQTRREIEKLNKRHRDAGRKKYVEQIHSLVAYVRKRDPRYIAIEEANEAKKVAEKVRKDQAKEEELARRAVEREKRLALVNSEEEIKRREEELEGAYLLADHSSSEDDDAWGEIGGRVRRRKKKKKGNKHMIFPSEYDSDEAAEILAVQMQQQLEISGDALGDNTDGTAATVPVKEVTYECEICSKTFKEEKQLLQHNNSKPHKQAMKEIAKKNKKTGTIGSASTESSPRSTATDGDSAAVFEPPPIIRQKNNKKKNGFVLRGAKGKPVPDSDDEGVETVFN